MKKVLITGISGGQGRLLAKRLLGQWHITGVDRVPWEGAPEGINVDTLDLRKKRFRNIIQTERPDAVVHLAFVRHFRSDPRLRHEVNVEGTQRLLEHCAEFGVGKIVVLSSSYVYGAAPDNPRYMHEDHPLNGSRMFPEIRDLIEVEGLVNTFLWRYPDISTSILRPVNTLMMQFIHEEDLSEAIALALEHDLRGVFNVAGPGALPLKQAIHAVGKSRISVPEPFARLLFQQLFRLNVYEFPPSALEYLKYPCTIAGQRFQRATGFEPLFSLEDIFASVAR
jgi:UDP-glucose 4-epimerase